ncbi:MAG TPA: NAD-glutamate dehydrogenase domain-containing protein [Acidimicrobiia bacterium]|nr:NAD-glutamate dehydrogenase domain-containing protein [Acidimicrobiia bacterium]
MARIRDHPDDRSDLVSLFTRSYLRRLPPHPTVSVDDLHEEVTGLYDFIETRTTPIAVRAFNPPEDHPRGESSGTVVEVHVDDSPFLVDSIGGELQARGLEVARVLHPVLGIQRDDGGRIIDIRAARASDLRESIQHWVLDRRLSDADLSDLQTKLVQVLSDVQAAVGDFDRMVGMLPRMIELVRRGRGNYPPGEIDEAVAFLEWLREDNFVFLGYREYEVLEVPEGSAIRSVAESGLGILSDSATSKAASPTLLSSLPPPLAARYQGGDLLVISKTNQMATVHRRARMDYVGVRIVAPDGRTVGEARLIGLFTSKAYMERSARTPVLRRKLDELAEMEDLIEGSHDHKEIVSLFESFPKDDLFGVPVEDLRPLLMGLLDLRERARVKLFMRRDLLDRSARLLVAIPSDRYSTMLAKRLEDLFLERFSGKSVDFNLTLEAGDLAYLHYKVWVEEGQVPEVAYDELEAEVREITRSWGERLTEVLSERHGLTKAREMVHHWGSRFPAYYTSSTELAVAVGDIERLEEMTVADRPFIVGVQNESIDYPRLTRVTLYGQGKRDLSALMPALEDMGLRVVEEVPTRLLGEEEVFVHDFGVLGPDDGLLDLEESGNRLTDALTAVWSGETETDSLNRLVLVSGLDHAQVAILRAYLIYWRRVRPAFTINYVNETLASHPDIAERLIDLFEMRFEPDADDSGYEAARYELLGLLDDVPSLDQDRILRGVLQLIEATDRTNVYRSDRTALSFKLRSPDVPDMPAPQPFAEVFVLGSNVEGVHLRAGPVARGGIRWSDRREDYRTEVLGLLKAQITKNSVIVPTGAKGGFVLRRPATDPDDTRREVAAAYSTFIRGLLDVTDNLLDGRVVHPDGVRVHDDDDPYLVVAADKGTATFSDTANEIAQDYEYWLDDAFASGGSTGYDHKALGITARGAWKSLERHLTELGIDPHRDTFTVAGIGDMSGDVFGNGMLGSPKLRLVAAFDHRHVFIDPDPDPAISFAERKRLFEQPFSAWADYDPKLISEGGGVHSRAAKKISLTPQAKDALGTEADTVTPADLIRIVLRAPVDVLWNGGIGTYVKAVDESNADAGDRTNDNVRVNGSELRCRVVVEGGNLGLTQRGRIEYAWSGGKINTDFIDNSGGVNCSDREVNLKILFGVARRRGLTSRDESQDLFDRVVGDVVDRILDDSLAQAHRLALEEGTSVNRLDSYEQLMSDLEDYGLLDRELEGLPRSEEMTERARSERGLCRPELGVILAYAKRSLVNTLLATNQSDPYELVRDVFDYFPGEVAARFEEQIAEHPLLRQLAATVVANELIDSQGSDFVSQLSGRTGASVPDIVRAYRIAREISGGLQRRSQIEQAFGQVDASAWADAINVNDKLVADLTRSYVRRSVMPDDAAVAALSEGFHVLEESGSELGPPRWAMERHARTERYVAAGFAGPMARRLAILPDLIHAPGIIELARQSGRPVREVGRVFSSMSQAVRLDSLRRILNVATMSDRWHRWAREDIEDDLIRAQRQLAERVLSEATETESGDEAVDSFLVAHAHALKRVLRLTQSLESDTDHDLAYFMVVLRQIEALAA